MLVAFLDWITPEFQSRVHSPSVVRPNGLDNLVTSLSARGCPEPLRAASGTTITDTLLA